MRVTAQVFARELQNQPGIGTRTVLETFNLSKKFGDFLAVDDLSFSMNAGEVLGFLGPNGAGKSTTVGMILNLIRPTQGSITIAGKPLEGNPGIVSETIGAIIENPAFYPYLTGRENLRALAMLSGTVDNARIDYLLNLVNMESRADQKYKTFSLGMKQRLGLAATLLTNPAIVILDEPTNGLDPAGQREVREIIPRLAVEGHSVFLASHLLNEVEQVSDRVAIIQKGKLVATGTVDELLRDQAYIEVLVQATAQQQAIAVLETMSIVERIESGDGQLRIVAPEDSAALINQVLAEAGIYAHGIANKRQSLEELFLGLTDEDHPTD